MGEDDNWTPVYRTFGVSFIEVKEFSGLDFLLFYVSFFLENTKGRLPTQILFLSIIDILRFRTRF